MKAKEVMSLLKISRGTLANYLKDGRLTGVKCSNGQWDYDDNAVYALLNKSNKCRTYLYARVEPGPDADELLNQQVRELRRLTEAFSRNIVISHTFRDISNSFDNRPNFYRMLHDVLAGKVVRVIVMNASRISEHEFAFFKYLFAHYGCDIVTASDLI